MTERKLSNKFSTVEELEKLVDEYFQKYPNIDDVEDNTDKLTAVANLTNGILPTLTGVCYKIGLNSLNDWQTLKNSKKYKRTCEKIILRLSRFWEAASATGRGQTGVSNWLDTFAGFPQKQALSQENRGVCAVVVIGSDGNKQALSDIISTAQAQRLQGIKTIDTTAQEIPARIQDKRTVKHAGARTKASTKPLKSPKKRTAEK